MLQEGMPLASTIARAKGEVKQAEEAGQEGGLIGLGMGGSGAWTEAEHKGIHGLQLAQKVSREALAEALLKKVLRNIQRSPEAAHVCMV